MKKEQVFLLSVLATAFDAGRPLPKAEHLSEGEWDRMIGESLFQAVGYLTFSLCQPFKREIPPALYEKWSRAAVKILGRNRNVVTAQNELVTLLESRPYVILKGLASAAYYPAPALRDFGDVDFLVPKDCVEEVSDLLLAAGYQVQEEANDHHTVFKKPYCHLELHRAPPGIPGGRAGEILCHSLATLQKNRELQTLDSDYLHAAFYAPAPAEHGLILLLHMQHHMTAEGLGLRHLLDWAFFVAKTAEEPFWQTELLPLLGETGLLTYAQALTKTCVLAFGCPAPAFYREIPDDLCRELLEDIFASGNFGGKDRGRAHSGMLISSPGEKEPQKGVRRAFRQMVKQKHPVLRRAPVLYPALAVWEFFGYGFGALFGRRTRPAKLLRTAKEREELYRRLRIFQSESIRPVPPADSHK